jgi:hypothetical protein
MPACMVKPPRSAIPTVLHVYPGLGPRPRQVSPDPGRRRTLPYVPCATGLSGDVTGSVTAA